MDKTHHVPCGKIPYRTQNGALQALKGTQFRSTQRKCIKAYLCTQCMGQVWHVTSQTEDKVAKKNKRARQAAADKTLEKYKSYKKETLNKKNKKKHTHE